MITIVQVQNGELVAVVTRIYARNSRHSDVTLVLFLVVNVCAESVYIHSNTRTTIMHTIYRCRQGYKCLPPQTAVYQCRRCDFPLPSEAL